MPNLTSIDSGRDSFAYQCSVTLESISKLGVMYVYRYPKSSKGKTTKFIPGSSIEIDFEFCLIVVFHS